MTKYIVSEERPDRSYFTQTPRLVWALCRSPYDYILWNVVKDVAGEYGECYLSTRNLAKMCMMSVGKVVDCRDYLISIGLLEWEMKPPHEYNTQDVMHLRIKDIWEENVKWSKKYSTISDRLKFKDGFNSSTK